MPIYEYKCRKCGARFEILVYSDQKKAVCEKCGSEDLKRLMSGFAAAASSSGSNSCSSSGGFT
jgi:putative FmdB family regulatory protein